MSGIYVHIPYCHGKCHYCDFFSTPVMNDPVRYIDAIEREYHLRKKEIGNEPPSTIYIGGGTPSILPLPVLERLFSFLPTDNVEEMTIEVNPEDVSADLAEVLADSPVNRVSMGVQSMDDRQLKFIGRRHTSADSIRAYDLLRSAGISNISLDLIFGLPGQDMQSWEKTLYTTLSLQPEHLSAYSLMIEPGTRLWAKIKAGKLTETPQDLSAMMYNALCEATSRHKMVHYEISNFSKPGFHSRHNSSYWNLTPYLGLGVSAHSFDGKMRRFNPSDIRRYIESELPVFETEQITETGHINEYIMIRMRTAEGIDLAKYTEMFGENERLRLEKAAKQHIERGAMQSAGNRLTIKTSQWLISDSILTDLFTD